jgi:flagellar basal body P-ring formation protein FlgA
MAHLARSPFAALAALSAAATAGTTAAPASSVPPAALARAVALAAELAQGQAPANARIVALPGTPDLRLKLAPCPDVQAQPLPGAPAWGRTRVLLRCATGPVAWRVALPVTVQVWAPAWVATRALPSGTTLDNDALAPGVVDWAAAATPALAPGSPLAGRTLARPLAAGEPLREADLRARQWFVAGDTVQVTARGSGFDVKAEAQALTAGVEGRPVRLKSSSGRVFMARPVGERRAEVVL